MEDSGRHRLLVDCPGENQQPSLNGGQVSDASIPSKRQSLKMRLRTTIAKNSVHRHAEYEGCPFIGRAPEPEEHASATHRNAFDVRSVVCKRLIVKCGQVLRDQRPQFVRSLDTNYLLARYP